VDVPLDYILIAIKAETDPRLSLPSPPATRTWRDPALLRRVAELYSKRVLVPSMVAAMEAAGKSAQKPVERAEAAAAGSTHRSERRTGGA
jgi:hypothetical protein